MKLLLCFKLTAAQVICLQCYSRTSNLWNIPSLWNTSLQNFYRKYCTTSNLQRRICKRPENCHVWV